MNYTRRLLLVSASFILPAVATLSFPARARAYPRKVPFQDTDAFDDALSRSMDEGFEAIDVELDRASAQKMPRRLRSWIARIQKTGGEVRFRDVTPRSRGVWVVLFEVIVGIVGPYAIEAFRKTIRDPATDYHAVLVGQGTSAQTAELLGVEFYRRGSSSWAEALDNSKAIKLLS